MNENVFKSKWKQMRGQLRQWRTQTRRRRPERVTGKFDKFIGLLQEEKDGDTREHAEEEFNRRLEAAKVD